MMAEKKSKTPEVEILTSNPQPEPKGVQIVGGSDAGKKGKLKIYDQKSAPRQQQNVQVVTHRTKQSYKDAISKDQ
jgi:hypothetical protein